MVNQVQKAEEVRSEERNVWPTRKAEEWASIECDIEALENCIAAIEEKMQANGGSDFGKLWLLSKKNWKEKEAWHTPWKIRGAMSISVNLIVREE